MSSNLSSNQVYARVRDGQVVQWPLHSAHQKNLGIPQQEVWPIVASQKPAHTLIEEAVERQPAIVDGKAVQRWEIKPRAKKDIDAAINAERDRRLTAGQEISVVGVADPIPVTGKSEDRAIYIGLLMLASTAISSGSPTKELIFRDTKNIIHTLTAEQMASLMGNAIAWFEHIMQVSWALKDHTSPFEAGTPEDFTADTHWAWTQP